MLVFWAGAGAALLGALVGGAFTAFAAVMQAKASFRAVDHELRQLFAHEKQQRSEQFVREAVRQRLVELSEVANILTDITFAHLTCDPKVKDCDRNTLPLSALRSIRRKLYTSDDIYAYRDLPIPDVCNSGYYYDILIDFLDEKSAASLPKRHVDMARELLGKYASSRCNYYLLASYGCDELDDVLDGLRRTRDSIGR